MPNSPAGGATSGEALPLHEAYAGVLNTWVSQITWDATFGADFFLLWDRLPIDRVIEAIEKLELGDKGPDESGRSSAMER